MAQGHEGTLHWLTQTRSQSKETNHWLVKREGEGSLHWITQSASGWGTYGSDGAMPRRWLNDDDVERGTKTASEVAARLASQGAAAGEEKTLEQEDQEGGLSRDSRHLQEESTAGRLRQPHRLSEVHAERRLQQALCQSMLSRDATPLDASYYRDAGHGESDDQANASHYYYVRECGGCRCYIIHLNANSAASALRSLPGTQFPMTTLSNSRKHSNFTALPREGGSEADR